MKSFFQNRSYSLKKSTSVFHHHHRLYKQKKEQLSPHVREEMRKALDSLQQAILQRDRKEASTIARVVEELGHLHCRKSFVRQWIDIIAALGFALAVAIVVRQMWFELYEIPTGSMRPTFKEKDRLVVSKTAFGINMPLAPDHFYFDPSLLKRSGIIIFTVENMDVRDPDTLYFYLFPGKKQFIKRLIGKPGDTLYFYGGLIYGIDQAGHDISPELQLTSLDQIEHIPFIRLEGNLKIPSPARDGISSPITFYQMNESLAQLHLKSNRQIEGVLLPSAPPGAKDYFDIWGMGNFAMARLLTKEQVRELTDIHLLDGKEGELYLELRHHPSIASAKLIRDEMGLLRPTLGVGISLLPLQEEHLCALFQHLYTSRFVVKNGHVRRYDIGFKEGEPPLFLPRMPEVPDGTYEFYEGIAYEIVWEGTAKKLPPDHPLYHFSAERIQMLYNLGIQFDTRYAPQSKQQRLFPSRYAYFRNGDLYLLGAPIVKKEDPDLMHFAQKELERAKAATWQSPYVPFVDQGPPLLPNGTLDIALIEKLGLKIPSKMYVSLGDNHAMSSDSRDYGFVPETNIRGAPDFIFWPTGARWGAPNQPPYPLFTLPRIIVWFLAALLIGGWYYVAHKRKKLPVKID